MTLPDFARSLKETAVLEATFRRMGEHRLGPGKQMISALVDLGTALGYRSEREFRYGQPAVPVDLAWFRPRGSRDPLFLFEIESTASAGLASNAMKILGRSASESPRPLHLFHVVVSGGLRSQRPKLAANEFASHNYTVHLLAADDEPRSLLATVLDAHRRLEDELNGHAFLALLSQHPWNVIPRREAVALADDLGFDGLRGAPLAAAALTDKLLVEVFVDHLVEAWSDVLDGRRPAPNRYLDTSAHRYYPYSSYMAQAAGEGLELGLIAATQPALSVSAFAALREWQSFNHIGDRPGPFTGAGSQWTEYAVEHLGYFWALIAALFNNVSGARRFCAEQPLLLLKALNQQPVPELACLASWSMLGAPPGDDVYASAAGYVARHGGLSRDWLTQPEPSLPYGIEDDEDAYREVFGLQQSYEAPSQPDLVHQIRTDGAKAMDPIRLGISALVTDPAEQPACGPGLAAWLATSR